MSQYNTKIMNSWSLIAFAKANGKMAVGDCRNHETNDLYKACTFTKEDGTRVFVDFSSNLGELTPREIAAQKYDLQVVQLESGNYKLCREGENTWEEVDLGI